MRRPAASRAHDEDPHGAQRRTAPAADARFDVDDAYGARGRLALVPEGRFDVERAVAALAARQAGVVSRRQLLGLGLSPRAIARRLAGGRLHALHRGVYAVGHIAVTWEGRARAALLAAGAGAALSHCSAAVDWRMLPDGGGPQEVTVLGRTPRHRPGIVVHTARTLEVRDHRGLPVTAPARTLLDLAAHVPRDTLARALAEAQVLGLATPADMRRAIRQTPNHRGARALAGMLDTTEPTRTKLERVLLDLLHRAGLPSPLVNAKAGPYEVDALWPAERMIVETDGWAAHGHRGAFERDRARDADLQSRGYTVLRFTWRQIADEPLLVAARIAQVLAHRTTSNRPPSEPPVRR